MIFKFLGKRLSLSSTTFAIHLQGCSLQPWDWPMNMLGTRSVVIFNSYFFTFLLSWFVSTGRLKSHLRVFSSDLAHFLLSQLSRPSWILRRQYFGMDDTFLATSRDKQLSSEVKRIAIISNIGLLKIMHLSIEILVRVTMKSPVYSRSWNLKFATTLVSCFYLKNVACYR